LPVNGAESPLLFDAAEVEASEAIVVHIPGALASIEIFSPTKSWKASGYALVYYRFPGLDGLPLDHELAIEVAAEEIARFANLHPHKPIRLLGYSTGGPIAILASQIVCSKDIKVAALSPAPPKAGGIRTVLRSSRDILAAAIRAGSIKREEVWREYYRTLLFGRVGVRSADLADRTNQIILQERENIVIPEPDISRAHTRHIRNWTVPDTFQIDPERISFYIGSEDPVFSVQQILNFADSIGVTKIKEYPRGGHLLFLTHPEVFDDVFSYFRE
jgi:pimeloyl-ACP methyl ester carboxylesterase